MERIASEGGDMTLKTYVATKWPIVTANSATYSNGERGPNLIEEAKK